MSALKKEDVMNKIDSVDQFMKSLSTDEKRLLAARIRNIKEMVQDLFYKEGSLYYGIVNKYLEEDGDIQKNDAYRIQ